MTPAELTTYLHDHIPLSAAMQLSVEELGAGGVTLSAPLEPNINHRHTAFGGSIASLATLAGWSLVHVGLTDVGLPSRVVVMSSQIEYLAPATETFVAHCAPPRSEDWNRFVGSVRRRGKGRLSLSVEVRCQGILCATLTGTFVGVAPDSRA
jgi:thioesterase domain-containing protein